MDRFTLTSRLGRTLALGALCASAAGATFARTAPDAEPFDVTLPELIPAARAAELPPELRLRGAGESLGEALGLPLPGGSRTVHLQWVVREHQAPLGYRVTLAAPDGLPGNVAARWWVRADEGVTLASGLTVYSAEIALNLTGAAPVAAAIETVDLAGHASVLGVRQAVAEADPVAASVAASRPATAAAPAGILSTARPTPTAAPAALWAGLALPGLRLEVRAESRDGKGCRELDGSVSPRGPPAARVTT